LAGPSTTSTEDFRGFPEPPKQILGQNLDYNTNNRLENISIFFAPLQLTSQKNYSLVEKNISGAFVLPYNPTLC
jgi:hypothetical protein